MMKNKKITLVMTSILLISMLLAGCGKDSTENTLRKQEALENADIEELAEYLEKNIEFDDFMSKVDKDILLSLYNLDENSVEDAVMYSSTGATAEELAVIQAKSGKSQEVAELCRGRIESQKEAFQNYVPEEMEKLSNPIIEKYGDRVVVIVCNDTKEAYDAIDAFKTINNNENVEI